MKIGRHLIVFDMDGVIVDVSASYREAVIQSAASFLRPAAGSQGLPQPLFPLSDLARLKQGGGLNNDWDLTCRVLELLFRLVPTPPASPEKEPWAAYEDTVSRCDVSPLARFLVASERPLSVLVRREPSAAENFIRALYTGDVGSGNVIKQIFQEIYLGESLFTSTYGIPPKVYRGRGLIERESLLTTRELIEGLANEHLLAIATGRPAAEAVHALRRFDLKDFFKMVYTLDDCIEAEERRMRETGRRESLSKPHPFMLDAIARETGGPPPSGRWYVGDMPDDMTAAARSSAGFKAVGVLKSAPDKEALRRRLAAAGADVIIDALDRLPEVLAGDGFV